MLEQALHRRGRPHPARGRARRTTRRATRYELFHDVLAEPILAWRARLTSRSARGARSGGGSCASAARLLALVAVFAALGIWALVERGSATRRLHFLQVFSRQLEAQNADLASQTSTLQNEADTAGTDAQAQDVRRLRTMNEELRGEVRGLTSARDDLDRRIGGLRARNGRLTVALARLNARNRGLASRITRLDRRNRQMEMRVVALSEVRVLLSEDAGILKRESRALRAQIRTASGEKNRLLARATRLGYQLRVAPEGEVSPVEQFPVPSPTEAAQFGIPAALALHDSLRRQVEALERAVAAQLARRAQLANAARWLQAVNALLIKQRDALRLENAQLVRTRAALAERNQQLRARVTRARAERARLNARLTVREARNATTGRTLAASEEAISSLQQGNNARVRAIGDQQDSLRRLQDAIKQLTQFLRGATNGLVKSSRASGSDALAGLLAAEAYLATPYHPDDGEHANVYNALWLALSRLDPATARDLIAPVAEPTGKLGTTTSKRLVQRICTQVGRPLTEQEWRKYLPGAPYPPDKQACG